MDLFAAQVRSLQNNQNYFPLSSLGNIVIMGYYYMGEKK